MRVGFIQGVPHWQKSVRTSETPRRLFDIAGRIGYCTYAPDGRFVAVLEDEEEPEPEQIVVIPDFAEELKAKFREAGR